ncbi:SWIB complex BAF60b domain-containing protein [Striga hermonthica]|uniref:SWIB complex BAF60b domain-containing protein n=1 Tax=Striga hermonthica TaxID=68872 RepID=A0A9N7NYG4_STRHE|nr:SWIB complex BAF60b domain-containing protein [Striga hermonthica]
MVSDSELIERLREFLSASDLNTTTTAIVRRRLEEDFGIDLSDRKAFIREQVDAYMQSQFENVADNEDEINLEADENEGDGEEEDEVEEEEEDEGAKDSTAGRKAKSSAKKTKKRARKEVKKRGGGGFTKLCSLSPELQKFTGVPELARTEVVKQVWSYIKENNLQDPSNRKNINCDETLRELFAVDTIDMFQMNKALAKHIWPLDSDGASSTNSAPKAKQQKQEKEKDEGSDEDEPKKKEKRPRGNPGLLAPLKLSDALVKFLGSGESELSRPDVVKRIWDYIKQHSLQDPEDKRQIICDEKLKELFNVDTFNGFSVTKHLKPHLIKMEQ